MPLPECQSQHATRHCRNAGPRRRSCGAARAFAAHLLNNLRKNFLRKRITARSYRLVDPPSFNRLCHRVPPRFRPRGGWGWGGWGWRWLCSCCCCSHSAHFRRWQRVWRTIVRRARGRIKAARLAGWGSAGETNPAGGPKDPGTVGPRPTGCPHYGGVCPPPRPRRPAARGVCPPPPTCSTLRAKGQGAASAAACSWARCPLPLRAGSVHRPAGRGRVAACGECPPPPAASNAADAQPAQPALEP